MRVARCVMRMREHDGILLDVRSCCTPPLTERIGPPPLPPSCGLKNAIMHDDRVHHIEGPKEESVGPHYASFGRGYGRAAMHVPRFEGMRSNLPLTLRINRRLVASNG